LSCTVSLGSLPPCRCSLLNSFWSTAFILSNVSGRTPYSRLNTTFFASCCFFPHPLPLVYHFRSY
jgi:hypothetical protein